MDETLQQSSRDDEILYTFQLPEYVKYTRGVWWYIIAGMLVGGCLMYALYTKNFLFGVIVVLLGFILILRDLHTPKVFTLHFTPDGVKWKDMLLPYRDFNSFWIVYDPPEVKKLYLLKKGITGTMIIPFGEQDPVAVRTWLRTKIKENIAQREETLVELLGRVLKL